MAHPVKTRTLQLAARKVGGPRRLRDRLKVSSARIADWLAGIEEPPQEAFLRALEIILDDADGSGR